MISLYGATLPKSFSVFLAKDFADELSRELALIGIPVIVNQTFFFVPRDALSYAKRTAIWVQDFWLETVASFSLLPSPRLSSS